MFVHRLRHGHRDALEKLLAAEPASNLFLLGFLEAHRLEQAHWYGTFVQGELTAVVLVVPTRLCVPFAPQAEHAAPLGRRLRRLYAPCMLVGPREACDALWGEWTDGTVIPRVRFDQRLYVCERAPGGPPVPGFRPGRLEEWAEIAEQAGAMEEEDLHHNPYRAQPGLHEQAVKARLRAGKTWVLERDGRLVFQINLGTALSWGAQVGGTFVPPDLRGHGVATEGMRAVCNQLLPRFPCVTLHVNEANRPAVRLYERVGFQRSVAYRLLTVP